MTEAYLEGNKLDLSKDLSALLNFAIDDVKEFAERSTAWSKTVVLPGTANNNKLLGHIFDVGHSNTYNPALPNVGYNFNAAKSANILLFQDNIQTFKGVMRLLEIISDNGVIEYEVQMLGELSLLNGKLASAYLSDLDFSEHNHTYSLTNIVNSWDNAGGIGYYYPLIDFGNYSIPGLGGKKDWDIRTFRPALYAKEYIDKIFSSAGFRYGCDLFNTTRFKKIVIPHNSKSFTKIGSELVVAKVNDDGSPVVVDHDGSLNPANIVFDSFTGTNFTIDASNQSMTYTGASASLCTIELTVSGYLDFTSYVASSIYASIGTTISGYIATGSTALPAVSPIFTVTVKLEDYNVAPGEGIAFGLYDELGVTGTYRSIYITSAEAKILSPNPTLINVNPGDNVICSHAIPKNIRQIDFLKSIVQLFNLYLYEDRFDSKLIHIKPYVDFFDQDPANAKDWTYKLNRAKPVRVKPMSDLSAKLYQFKFKSDSDYYNDQYKKRYNEGYGDLTYNSDFEFSAATESIELVFSATPLVGYQGEDKIFSTIFKRNGNTSADYKEEQIDSNIRILQTKKITGVTSWKIKDGATDLGSYTAYPYAGHYDDPDAPTNDLNFGVPQELFYSISAGNVSTTQFNVYWSPYMAEITHKDSKLLTGKFYLTSKDINELDFSKLIYLDGFLWKLNKISEYNANYPDECAVELFKVNNLNY